MIRWPRVASAITAGVVTVVLSGCMSLESIQASRPTRTAVVKGSAPAIARCVQSELDLSISDFDPGGTKFALLARCDVCMQGHFYEITVRQLEVPPGGWDQVQIELRENWAFVLGIGDPWKKVERCMSPG